MHVFLSYASADRDRAGEVARALESHGHAVWWDRTIPPGRVFDEVIQEALDAASCVVVLWSETSVRSNWVKTEASSAQDRGILVPARIDPVDLPLEFRRIQTADLTEWDGDAGHQQLESLLDAVTRITRRTPASDDRKRKDDDDRKPRGRGWRFALGLSSGSRTWRLSLSVGFAALLAAVGTRALFKAGTAPGGSIDLLPPGAPGVTSPAPAPTDPATAPGPSPGTPGDATPPRAPTGGSLPLETPDPVGRGLEGTVNLLAPDHGGHIVAATGTDWVGANDGQPVAYVTGGEAVFAFHENRPATFDTLAVYIGGSDTSNVKTIELLAGDELPSGPFRPIGTFTTRNVLVFEQPFQTFRFPPVTTRYVKIRLVSDFLNSPGPMYAAEFQLLGRLE